MLTLLYIKYIYVYIYQIYANIIANKNQRDLLQRNDSFTSIAHMRLC